MQFEFLVPTEGFYTEGRFSSITRELTREVGRGRNQRRVPNGVLAEVVIAGQGKQEVRVPSASKVKVKFGQKCILVKPVMVPTVVQTDNGVSAGCTLKCDEIIPAEGE